MESIDLKRLNLTIEESRDIIKFIAQKRGISTEKLLSTIQANLKHKNNEILTTKTHQEATKIHQEATKIHQEATKIHQEAAKIHQEATKIHQKATKTHEKIKKIHEKIKKTQQVAKTQQRSLKLQNLTYEKPSKVVKRETLTSQKTTNHV